jgi:hypothetical protein
VENFVENDVEKLAIRCPSSRASRMHSILCSAAAQSNQGIPLDKPIQTSLAMVGLRQFTTTPFPVEIL